MDRRLLALADVINSAAPAGAQAVLKYTLKEVPGSPLPPGRKLRPYIKLTRNYERTWHRAMRKIKIVNMLRRMGRERMRRRESEELLFNQHGLAPPSSHRENKRFVVQQIEHGELQKLHHVPSGSGRRTAQHRYRREITEVDGTATNITNAAVQPMSEEKLAGKDLTQTASTDMTSEGQRRLSLDSSLADIQIMKGIAIQTEKPSTPPSKGSKEKKKEKKVKRKTRAMQVKMADSHLDLAAIRQMGVQLKASRSLTDVTKVTTKNKLLEKNRNRTAEIKRTVSESSLDQLKGRKNNGRAQRVSLQKAGTQAQSRRKNKLNEGKEMIIKQHKGEEVVKPAEKKRRGESPSQTKNITIAQSEQATNRSDQHRRKRERKIRNDTRESSSEPQDKKNKGQSEQKPSTDNTVLLYKGRVHKPGYSPNLDQRNPAKQLHAKDTSDGKRKTVLSLSSDPDKSSIGQVKDSKENDQVKVKDGVKVKPNSPSPNSARKSTKVKSSAKRSSSGKKSLKDRTKNKEETKTKDIEKVEEGNSVTPEITVEDHKEAEHIVITERKSVQESHISEDLKPPGDAKLESLEQLFATSEKDEKGTADLDPTLVAKVEEQIFEKIKFYKDVQSKVREKTWFIRKKMMLRGEANAYTSRFEGVSSGTGGVSYAARLKVTLHKMSRELSNYAALMIPWEGKIKNIESYFGSVVASYFTFLRWLFWINFVMSVICGVVIIMPEVMFGPDMGSVDYKSVPVNDTGTASYLKTLWNFNGYVEVSPIFYGYYSSIRRYDSGYRMPFAYLLGNLMMFGYSFLTILKQMAANSRNEKATDKDDNFTFSWKAFSSWDYMIGNEETAKNKYKALVIAIRESVTESKESAKKISKKTKFLRVLANFMVLLVLAASTYAIYLTVDRSREFQARVKKFGPNSVSWVESNEVSLVMSLVTAFCPMVFDVIANLEDYHPRIALQWSLRRIMVLYLLNLYTLYIALYWKIQDIENEAERANSTFYDSLNMSEIVPCTSTTTIALPMSTVNFTSSPLIDKEVLSVNFSSLAVPCGIPKFVPEVTCWETMVGQELIKLTVFDFLTTVGLIYVTEFFRAAMIKVCNACWCWDLEIYFPGYAEFSLADNLLHLVYNQGMIWMGTLFCPGLPALNLFKLLCLFYVRAWAVMVCNVPHERIFKAGSDNFYLMLLLFMLYVVMIPIAFAMVSIKPSRHCGPYRETKYMYLVITEWMQDVFNDTIFSIFRYLTSPGALIPIFILLLLCIYYLSSNNDALHGTVLDLKKQLQYERTEGKKRVFNMNKAAEAAIPETAILAPEVKEKVTEPEEPGPNSMTSVILAKKFISNTRGKAQSRKVTTIATIENVDELKGAN